MHTLLACHWPSTVPVLCFTQNSLFSCSKAVNLHYIIALQFHLSEQNLRSQVILLNEIPLLSRKKDLEKEIQDDITATLGDIQTELIYYYYKVAEKYAKPDAIEHLASFVHLLPKRVMKKQYTKLTNINNNALLERLIYKMSMLPEDLKDYAIFKLAQKLDGNNFREDIINLARFADPRVKEAINKKYGLV